MSRSSYQIARPTLHTRTSSRGYEDLQTVFGTYQAMGELDSVAVKFDVLMNHTDADEDWLDLHEIHVDLASEYKSWFDIDTTQETTIRNIATQEENTLAKVQAQNVLNLVYRDTFPDYVDEEEYYLRQQQPEIKLTTSKRKTGLNQLILIPNPANDFITIIVEGVKSKNCNLEIIDITGKQRYYSNVDFANVEFSLNVEFLNSGLYLVRITDGKKLNLSSKLMITR